MLESLQTQASCLYSCHICVVYCKNNDKVGKISWLNETQCDQHSLTHKKVYIRRACKCVHSLITVATINLPPWEGWTWEHKFQALINKCKHLWLTHTQMHNYTSGVSSFRFTSVSRKWRLRENIAHQRRNYNTQTLTRSISQTLLAHPMSSSQIFGHTAPSSCQMQPELICCPQPLQQASREVGRTAEKFPNYGT